MASIVRGPGGVEFGTAAYFEDVAKHTLFARGRTCNDVRRSLSTDIARTLGRIYDDLDRNEETLGLIDEGDKTDLILFTRQLDALLSFLGGSDGTAGRIRSLLENTAGKQGANRVAEAWAFIDREKPRELRDREVEDLLTAATDPFFDTWSLDRPPEDDDIWGTKKKQNEFVKSVISKYTKDEIREALRGGAFLMRAPEPPRVNGDPIGSGYYIRAYERDLFDDLLRRDWAEHCYVLGLREQAKTMLFTVENLMRQKADGDDYIPAENREQTLAWVGDYDEIAGTNSFTRSIERLFERIPKNAAGRNGGLGRADTDPFDDYYGAAEPFMPNDGYLINLYDNTKINCYAYAMKKFDYEHERNAPMAPGYHAGLSLNWNDPNLSLTDISNAVIADAWMMGGSARVLTGPNGSIDPDEYRIALRIRQTNRETNFHFMVQNSDGSWSEKDGDLPPKQSGNSVEAAPWVGSPASPIYYTSEIVYMAIKKGWNLI